VILQSPAPAVTGAGSFTNASTATVPPAGHAAAFDPATTVMGPIPPGGSIATSCSLGTAHWEVCTESLASVPFTRT
jgi:hypothetical protein